MVPKGCPLTKLFRVIVQRVDRPPFVGTYHHVRGLNAWERVGDYPRHERFPLPFDRGYIQVRPIRDGIDQGRLPEGTDNDRIRIRRDRHRCD